MVDQSVMLFSNPKNLGTLKNRILFICAAALFGIIATIVTYDGFGYDSHIEHLPIINRAMDSTYLENDFLTTAGSIGIARQYYTLFISKLAGSAASLPGLFLALTMMLNSSLSVITYLLARHLHKNSAITGLLASAFVMSISTTAFGRTYPYLYSTFLLQSFIAFVLIALAVLLASKRRVIFAMLVSGISSILHPQWGLEMGALVLFSYGASILLLQKKMDSKQLKGIIWGLIIYITFSLPSIIPQLTQQSINSDTFVHIAYFRNGHHYLPSTFPVTDIINTVGFLAAIGVAWLRIREQRENFASTFLTVIVGSVLLLCLVNGVFVEIFPARIWVTTQLFRLFSMVRWLGLILIAGMFTSQTVEKHTQLLYLINVFHPVTLSLALLSQSLKDWLKRRGHFLHNLLEPAAVFLILLILVNWFFISIPFLSILLFTIYLVLILIFVNFPDRWLYAALVSMVGLSLAAVMFHERVSINNDSYALGKFNRIYDQLVSDHLSLSIRSDLGDEGDEITNFTKLNTPKDSIFLTPPNWGQFRLLAERAIVVDFNAFVFTDVEMLEWYERITDCYGTSDKYGNKALDDLLVNYASITGEQIHNIQNSYGINYAVLLAETTTNFEILYQNEAYKIIVINSSH